MKRKLCIFLAAIMMCTFFSACKITENASLILPKETEIAEKTQTVEVSDTVKIALNHARSLNPYDPQDLVNLQAFRLIYEPLFDYDENMKIVPVLAESWSVLDGGKAISVRIKDGVKLHNGSILTANDVLNTLNLVLNTQSAYSQGIIEMAQMIDERTVLITFFQKHMSVEEKLLFPIVGTDGVSIFGTGPYKFDGKDSSDVYGFSRHEGYHGQIPAIANVRMINTPNIDSVVRLFDIGETDILTSDAFNYATFKADDEMSVYDYPVNTFVYLGINFDNSIFWGENTRQALMYVLNKEDIVEKAMYKKAVKADFPINPASWLYPKEMEYRKDNAKAEELLSLESWTRSDGVFARMIDGRRQNFKINMLVPDDAEMRTVAAQVEKTFDNFGIECDLVVKSYEEFWLSVQNKEYDVFLDKKELSGSADFESLIGVGNVFGYLNSDLNTVMEQIRIERDENNLKQRYIDCCNIFLKDTQFIPLFFCKEAVITDKNISKNVVPSLYNPFYNISEWNK